jgi:3-oxoacyl-[acyl-carrier protein] reductase
MTPMLNDSGLAGKVAVITGGSRGIGRAIVELLAAHGADVTFFFRDNAAAAAEVAAAGKRIDGALPVGHVQVDVRDAAACAAAVERVAERAGRVDILVNNAGLIRDNQLAAMDDDDVELVLDTNVGGVFNMARAVVPHMIVQRSGKIINLSSVSGEKGGRGQTNYAASKGAVNAFTRALAVELAPRNITVNAVAPGVIETEMSEAVREMAGSEVSSRILLKRYGKAEEVAYAVGFLASRYADYVTGQIFAVDGGFKME